MAERETSQDIDQAASRWTARLDRAPLNPEEEKAFQAWLNGDPRSKGAMLRAQALSIMSESAQALGPGFDPAPFEKPTRSPVSGISRRRALTWTGGAAIAAASLIGLGVSMPAAGAVISTRRGEIRLVPLKDGSTVLLNTDTSVRVDYDESERCVSLLKGEAYFSVTRDESRPFIVEVNKRRLRAAQGQFRVRKLDSDPVDILVNQGRVDLPATGAAGSADALALTANMRLILSDPDVGPAFDEHPQLIAPETVSRELSWRDGKLAFEGESLKQAADIFARYSDTHIQIRDPALAREPVTGLFAANDPAGFSRAVARVFDATAEQRGDLIVLTRNAAAH